MRLIKTPPENGHGAMVRDTINVQAAALREAMHASGEGSKADKVWLALASWLRNNSMMPVVQALGRRQQVNQPLLAGGQVYLLSIIQPDAQDPQHLRLSLSRVDDAMAWHV